MTVSKRSFRTALVIVLTSLVLVGLMARMLYGRWESYPVTANKGSGAEVKVTIDRGMPFPAIAKRLHAHGIIDNPTWFRLYAMHKGKTTKVRSGSYTLKDNWAPDIVLAALLEGVKEVTVSVTIREGLHFREVFDEFAKQGVVSADGRMALEQLAWDTAFLASLGIEGKSVEGYLFPDTYRFRVPSSPKKVIETLVKQHRKVWAQVRKQHQRSLDRVKRKLKWTDRDALIMASIVEKESVLDSERPRIAQVFMNRLTDPKFRPKKLDTDPTIRYGCSIARTRSDLSKPCQNWDPTKRLRRAQLDDKNNKYNTYQHEGLPPGPIASPGRRSLEAVADPDGSKFFFFVAHKDKSGAHVFSRTRAQHERAVDKHIRGK